MVSGSEWCNSSWNCFRRGEKVRLVWADFFTAAVLVDSKFWRLRSQWVPRNRSTKNTDKTPLHEIGKTCSRCNQARYRILRKNVWRCVSIFKGRLNNLSKCSLQWNGVSRMYCIFWTVFCNKNIGRDYINVICWQLFASPPWNLTLVVWKSRHYEMVGRHLAKWKLCNLGKLHGLWKSFYSQRHR